MLYICGKIHKIILCRLIIMDGKRPALFTKVILTRDADVTSVEGAIVKLEVDLSYKIGRSIAVLHNEKVIGHLERRAARVVWRHLQSNPAVTLTAEVYHGIGNWKNSQWYSVLSNAFEIGVKVLFHTESPEDSRVLLAHITRKRLHNFPGVEIQKRTCPEELRNMVRPFEDENGVASLYFV